MTREKMKEGGRDQSPSNIRKYYMFSSAQIETFSSGVTGLLVQGMNEFPSLDDQDVPSSLLFKSVHRSHISATAAFAHLKVTSLV